MNVESESILLRRMEFFLQYDIEVWLRKEVSFLLFFTSVLTSNIWMSCFYGVKCFSGSVLLCWQALSVNTDQKTVTFDDGSVQSYDQLFIATGSRYRLLEFRLYFSIQTLIHSF